MMRLKNLFENDELAQKVLDRWEHVAEPLFWRASSNMVYRCSCGGRKCFLRMSPQEEKDLDQIKAELKYIRYLRAQSYPLAGPIPSKNERDLEEIATDTGVYYAVLFEAVPGQPLDMGEMDEGQAWQWGRHLGWLHRLTMGYHPKGVRRTDWRTQMVWMRKVLDRFYGEDAAKKELADIDGRLDGLPDGEDTYGLVHYDFETDNVFAHGDGMHVIDFDDAVYHFYAMDVAKCLREMEDAPKEMMDGIRRAFLTGYRTEKALGEEMEKMLPYFGGYADLLSYVKILRAMEDHEIENPPEWYTDLCAKLSEWCDSYRERIET